MFLLARSASAIGNFKIKEFKIRVLSRFSFLHHENFNITSNKLQLCF